MNGFFEPFNTISNIVYLIAAVYLFLYFRKNKINSIQSNLIVVLTAAIAIGSTLWHVHRTLINNLIDTIPIYLLLILLLYGICEKAYNAKKPFFYILVPTFILAFTFDVTEFLHNNFFLGNGTLSYLVVFFAFSIPILKLREKGDKIFHRGVLILALFIIPIFFRWLDPIVCNLVPFGTHFLWHIINGFIIYFFVKLIYEIK